MREAARKRSLGVVIRTLLPYLAVCLLAFLGAGPARAQSQLAPEPVVPGNGAAPVEPAPATPPSPPVTATTGKSMVYSTVDRSAVQGGRAENDEVRRMVDRLVLAITGQREVGKAWQTLVRPDDRVGIKVNAAGGAVAGTHPGIVAAIVAGLESAGLPRGNIVVWDRQTSVLRAAGYVDQRHGYRVRAVDPPGGFDPAATFSAPMLGTLIWGDLSFQGRASTRPHLVTTEPQISGASHLARLVSQEVTRIISVPTFSDERGCGVAGALYNVTVPNVDNWRRFTQAGGSSSICDLFADPRIGSKVTLTIVDGLYAQYAAGPEFDPNYALAHHTLYASRDPVALDATLLRKLEVWRKEAKLPPIGERANWLREAQTIGLGSYDEDRIALVPLSPGS